MPKEQDDILVRRFPQGKTMTGKQPRVILRALRLLLEDPMLNPNKKLVAVQLLCFLEGLTPSLPVEYRKADKKLDYGRGYAGVQNDQAHAMRGEKDDADLAEHDRLAGEQLTALARALDEDED